MAGCCSHDKYDAAKDDRLLNNPRWRQALWIALFANAGVAGAEIIAGVTASSASLQADALDFLGDTITYGLSLAVAGLGLTWRARAALVKGWGLILLGAWVIGATFWHILFATLPQAEIMGAIGILALAVNLGVALILFRFRTGDSNMRSVWICSRNDAIGNIAVVLAAMGVFGTGTGWPDVIVAAIMAALSISGGLQIVRQARFELRLAATKASGSPGPRRHMSACADEART